MLPSLMVKQQHSIATFLQATGSGDKRPGAAEPECTAAKRQRRRSSSFQRCPLCGLSFPFHTVQAHAADCDGDGSSAAVKGGDPSNCKTLRSVPVEPREKPRELIPGLFVYEEFISPEEEALILAQLYGTNSECNDEYIPWMPSKINGKHMGKRWGRHCTVFGLKSAEQVHPLPDFVRRILLDKLKGVMSMKGIVPDEANAIEYIKHAGHYLKAHVDDRKRAEEPIANISLAGDCYMTFTNTARHRNGAVAEQRVLLRQRCLMVMTSTARYDFTHAISNADLLSPKRVSVTLRRATAPPALQTNLLPNQPSRWWNNPVQQLVRAAAVTAHQPTVSEPIPGLLLFEDFISADEETTILADLDKDTPEQPWITERRTGLHSEKRFGVDHDLWTKHLRPAKHPIPSWFHELLQPKLGGIQALHGCVLNEMNVIDYRRSRGCFLKSHMDDRVKYKEPIANLSLAGDCWMTFGKERDRSFPPKKILLKRRTLQILTGKARYEWTHGIEAADILSERRVSVTMRETVGRV